MRFQVRVPDEVLLIFLGKRSWPGSECFELSDLHLEVHDGIVDLLSFLAEGGVGFVHHAQVRLQLVGVPSDGLGLLSLVALELPEPLCHLWVIADITIIVSLSLTTSVLCTFSASSSCGSRAARYRNAPGC